MSNLVSLKKIAEDKTTGIGIKKVTDYMLDPRAISIEPGFNARDMVNMSARTRAHIDAMKVAIRGGATLPPLDVRVSGDKIYVVDGHCRLTAYLELIAEGVEILLIAVRQFNGNDEDRDIHVVNSASQLHLTRLEQGRIYKRRVGFGWSVSMIAERVNKSPSYVEQNIMLASANSDVHRLLEDDKVSAKVALDAIRKHGEQAGAVLLRLIENKGGKLTGASVTKGIPPKAARRVTDAVGALFGSANGLWVSRIRNMPDDATAVIEVPASLLRALLDAHEAAAPKADKAQEAT